MLALVILTVIIMPIILFLKTSDNDILSVSAMLISAIFYIILLIDALFNFKFNKIINNFPSMLINYIHNVISSTKTNNDTMSTFKIRPIFTALFKIWKLPTLLHDFITGNNIKYEEAYRKLKANLIESAQTYFLDKRVAATLEDNLQFETTIIDSHRQVKIPIMVLAEDNTIIIPYLLFAKIFDEKLILAYVHQIQLQLCLLRKLIKTSPFYHRINVIPIIGVNENLVEKTAALLSNGFTACDYKCLHQKILKIYGLHNGALNYEVRRGANIIDFFDIITTFYNKPFNIKNYD